MGYGGRVTELVRHLEQGRAAVDPRAAPGCSRAVSSYRQSGGAITASAARALQVGVCQTSALACGSASGLNCEGSARGHKRVLMYGRFGAGPLVISTVPRSTA